MPDQQSDKMYIDHRILVVDDDKDDQDMIKAALNETNLKYKIIPASDGVEALNRIHELSDQGELPCLIILDMHMPRMGGQEFLSKVRHQYNMEQVPIVIFSTADKMQVDDFYSGLGANYFDKPVEYDRFCQTVQKFLSVCEHASNA